MSPLSFISLVIVTISESTGIFRSKLSKCTLVLAILGPRLAAPSTSCMSPRKFGARITLGLFSPSAKVIASKMLLLPEPFGPEIDTNPGSKSTIVFLNPNDLNPKISTFFT